MKLPMNLDMDRRQCLYGLGASIGAVAFQTMLAGEEQIPSEGPLAAKSGPFRSKIKSCIFLCQIMPKALATVSVSWTMPRRPDRVCHTVRTPPSY